MTAFYSLLTGYGKIKLKSCRKNVNCAGLYSIFEHVFGTMIGFFHTGIKLLFYSLISYCFFPFQLYITTAFLYLQNCDFSCEKNIGILKYYLFIFYVFVFSESRSKVHANKYYWLFTIQKCPRIYEGVMDSSFKCTRKYWWYSF